MSTFRKAELTGSVHHIERFQNQEYRFLTPNSQEKMVEKKKKKAVHGKA